MVLLFQGHSWYNCKKTEPCQCISDKDGEFLWLEDCCSWLWLWLSSTGNSCYWYEFVSVPLTIQVADQVYRWCHLDIDHMMETMYATSEASKSACPSPDDYREHLKVLSISLSLLSLVLFQVAIIVHNSLRISIWKNILTLRFMWSIHCLQVVKLTWLSRKSIVWLIKDFLMKLLSYYSLPRKRSCFCTRQGW